MFVIPCDVLGEITYHPQLPPPPDPAQPVTSIKAARISSARKNILI
jgi:hypothetical protein